MVDIDNEALRDLALRNVSIFLRELSYSLSIALPLVSITAIFKSLYKLTGECVAERFVRRLLILILSISSSLPSPILSFSHFPSYCTPCTLPLSSQFPVRNPYQAPFPFLFVENKIKYLSYLKQGTKTLEREKGRRSKMEA